MLNKLPIAIALFSVATYADARGLDVKLADEMAELTYLTESSTFGYGGADVGFGLLYTEADDLNFSGKLMVTGNPAGNNRPFQFGVGGKLMLTSFDRGNNTEEVGALAIGAQARYVIPSAPRLHLLPLAILRRASPHSVVPTSTLNSTLR